MKKIGIIGANGRLGSLVTEQAIERGYPTVALIYQGQTPHPQAEVRKKDLFSLTPADVQDLDVLISCFGSGFDADPQLNQKAFSQYQALACTKPLKLITIAGAGSLYTDSTHTQFEYESKTHPQKLKDISRYIRLGVETLKQNHDFPWVVVCPSRHFDYQGPLHETYLIGQNEEIMTNDAGQSYVTYRDLAQAMVDLIEDDTYLQQVITIVSPADKQ